MNLTGYSVNKEREQAEHDRGGGREKKIEWDVVMVFAETNFINYRPRFMLLFPDFFGGSNFTFAGVRLARLPS